LVIGSIREHRRIRTTRENGRGGGRLGTKIMEELPTLAMAPIPPLPATPCMLTQARSQPSTHIDKDCVSWLGDEGGCCRQCQRQQQGGLLYYSFCGGVFRVVLKKDTLEIKESDKKVERERWGRRDSGKVTRR
jgi:hypothetical protein